MSTATIDAPTKPDAPSIETESLTGDEWEKFTEMLDHFDDELKCEARHAITPCTVTVTHRTLWCMGGSNLCDQAAEIVQAKIEASAAGIPIFGNPANRVCAACDRKVHECWTVYKI